MWRLLDIFIVGESTMKSNQVIFGDIHKRIKTLQGSDN
jgi:hypothetical protein